MRSSRRNGAKAQTGRSAASSADRPVVGSAQAGLQIECDPAFQRVMWRIERAGWVAMFGVLVAALLGLFGRGPLSRTFAVDADSPLALEHERFGRVSSPDRLRLHLLPGSSRGGEIGVSLDRAFLESVEDLEIQPEPLRAASGAGWIRYQFAATDSGRPTVISLRYKPNRPGRLSGRVALDGNDPLPFAQFVFP